MLIFFKIKNTKAILSNSTRELLWFEITKMPIAVWEKKLLCHLCNFRHTFIPINVCGVVSAKVYTVYLIDWTPSGCGPETKRTNSARKSHHRHLLLLLIRSTRGWLGSRVVSVLDSGAEGLGFKSQPRRCRVTVLRKLFTPIVPLFTKQRNW